MKILGLLQSWSKKENSKLTLQEQQNTVPNLNLNLPVYSLCSLGFFLPNAWRLLLYIQYYYYSWCFFGYWSILIFLKNCRGYTHTREILLISFFQIFHLSLRAQSDDAVPGYYTCPILLQIKNQP